MSPPNSFSRKPQRKRNSTMSILKRLRDALRIRRRPHRGEPTSASRYPLPFRRLGRLFRAKSRPKQCSTGYGTNGRKQSWPVEDKESPSIIPSFAFDAQSTFWPSLLDVTSATLVPAQIIGQSHNTKDDEVINIPTTGVMLSPQFSHPRTADVPPLRSHFTFCTSLLDVTTDSFPPAGSISHAFNTEDGNPSYVPATRATASLLAQLTTEPRLSPPNTRPFRFLSLPSVSLDDLSFADFIGHAPDNEDGDAGKVLTAETTISLSSSLLDVSSVWPPAAGPIGHIFDTEDTNALNASVTGTTASSRLAQPTTEHRSSVSDILLFRPHSFSTARLDDLAAAESIGHSPDNEEGDAENVATAEAILSLPTGTYCIFNAEDRKVANIPVSGPLISLQRAQLTTECGASPTNILPQSPSTVGLDGLAPVDIGHIPDNEDRDVPAAEATVSLQTARILELPTELLCKIMAFLLSTEPLYAPTHLRLLAPRHVCRRLRNAAEQEIPMTLNASRRPFDAGLGGDLELTRWFKGRAKFQYLRHAVSFRIDTRHSLDKNLLKDFVGALLNCRQARVEIQGPAAGSSPITTSTVLPSHIHSFSWISATLGVRDRIPVDEFPWRILVNDLPWAQLTHLSLDCPLSDLDAFDILSNGSTTLETVSLKLTEINSNPLGGPVALPSLRSLTIDTHLSVQDMFSKLSLSALENLDLKSHVSPEGQDSPLLNQHLNIPWSQLRSLSLSNEDTRERRRCPVTAILMECRKLQRFQWEGPSDTFQMWTSVLSFTMSQQLEELIVKSDPQGCKLLLERLSYRGNVIRRVNISYLDLDKSPYTYASLPRWTHITVSEGVKFSNFSEILINGQSLIKAAFLMEEGGAPLTSWVSSEIQELEIRTFVPTASLWKWLESNAIQSVKISFGGLVSDHSQVLDDMAPFFQRYPNLRSPLISPIHSYSPYDLSGFDVN